MENLQKYKSSVSTAKNPTIVNDEVFKKLLENCFHVLTEKKEIHSVSSLHNSKPDLITELYASLLSITSEFARRSSSKEEIFAFLQEECGLSSQRANIYYDYFAKNKQRLEISLLSIGNYLPHLIDVKWKIDYIVKSSEVDASEGPLFRICLIGQQYDSAVDEKVLTNYHFTCNSVELLDLIHKLKDAARHCNTITQRLF
ncbi:COMM domain-containing protein 3 [Diorhabda carinulata]|uniref:COMM domain-containing protein 3 n=1 Tax=Diorhabda carinulata TaxID=1163345 RepID=UPI0025A1E8CC|nr:COMM domain-containing protein 3 [Diorhabda carinulata]